MMVLRECAIVVSVVVVVIEVLCNAAISMSCRRCNPQHLQCGVWANLCLRLPKNAKYVCTVFDIPETTAFLLQTKYVFMTFTIEKKTYFCDIHISKEMR